MDTMDTFFVKVQKMRRIAIPKRNYELLGLKEGELLKVKITKVKI